MIDLHYRTLRDRIYSAAQLLLGQFPNGAGWESRTHIYSLQGSWSTVNLSRQSTLIEIWTLIVRLEGAGPIQLDYKRIVAGTRLELVSYGLWVRSGTLPGILQEER